MRIIIYDHKVSFKRGGRYLEMYAENIKPFEIKGGDTVRLDHKVDVSIWEIVRSVLLREPLVVYSSENELLSLKGGELNNGPKSKYGKFTGGPESSASRS